MQLLPVDVSAVMETTYKGKQISYDQSGVHKHQEYVMSENLVVRTKMHDGGRRLLRSPHA